MSRRIVLPWLLALAVACAAAAQSSGQPAPDAPTPQPGASQQAPPQDTTAQSSAQTDQKKKDGWLKRTLKRAAPDCVNIGTSYCRDENKTEDDQGKDQQQQAPKIPANQAPPRSDSDHATAGSSSSRDTQIDLSPPSGDDLAHPGSAEADSVTEFHPWDPHKAAKDIEVGDFYFKRENFRAAESRYRSALKWKPNDAEATFRLAEALDRQHREAEALDSYQAYLKILPNGDFARQAGEAIARLKQAAPSEPKNSAKK